ncbi:MAG: hypothetical protein NC211_06930 [Alistipes senegalensis]|nr:hypothetical protein [Oxalobacter formigenes]MCM1281544.1 hypothetical protein [Alistipes senegalensis]
MHVPVKPEMTGLNILFLAVSVPGFSLQAEPPGRMYSRCMEEAGITIGMDNCTGAEYDRLDKVLHAAYRDLAAG